VLHDLPVTVSDLRGRSRFRAGLGALLAVALAIGAGIAIGKAAHYTRLLHELRAAHVWWLSLCLAGELVRYGGYLAAYRAAARVDGGPELSVRTALRVVAAGFGVLVVATGVGALAVDYWALRRAGESRHEALARVLALNTLEWAVLSAAATAAAAALLVGVGPDVPPEALLPWLAIVPACFAAAAWFSAPTRRARFVQPGGSRFRDAFAAAIRGVVLVRMLVTRPGRGLAGAAVYWAGDLLCLWGALKAFGVQIGIAALVLAYATGYVVAALPLPAGGAGGVDAAMTYALTLVGVPLAAALLGTFAYRLFNFWLPVVPALALLPGARGLSDDLRAAETGFVH
jgi:glycosyltransferase 2 family protein